MTERSLSPVPVHVLRERVAALESNLAKQAPAAVAALGEQAAALARAGAGAGAPRAGDPAPDFRLPDARGGEVGLGDLLGQGPVVLVFYRGQWCPYCDLMLRAYQEVLPRIRALGATLVAISPQTPDESLSTAEQRALAFPVLSDRGNQVARRYGLVFTVPAGLDQLHRAFGIDLARTNGDASNELPVPGVFVVARGGRIAFAHADADWRARLEPAELVRQVERLG